MNSVLQAKALKFGLDYRALCLITYIKDTYIFTKEYTSVDITNNNPLIFINSTEVKRSLDLLEDCDMISIDYWSKGKFMITPNADNLKELFTNSLVQIVKDKKVRRVKKEEISGDIKLILDEYNKTDMPSASLTDRRKKAIDNVLSKYKVEDIIDALKFACSQRWVLDKSSENWMDLAWILNRIDEFMEGGKYRKKQDKKQDNIIPVSKVSVIL